jgi:hypothetical protein
MDTDIGEHLVMAERGCVRSVSRSTFDNTQPVEFVRLFVNSGCCGWSFGHSRAPKRRIEWTLK